MQKLCILLATVLLGLTSAASGSELNLSNCFSKSDGTIFPIEDNCNAFIYCLRQQALVVPCGLDMGFSKTAQGCVAVDQSDCIVNTWLDFEESPRHKSGESKGSKENSKGNSKENSKGNSKENSKGNSKENSKEKSKENSKGNSKENSKEKSKENSKEKTSNEIECGGPIGFDADGCVGYDNGVLWRYKYNCNAYINCTDECPVMFYCPKDKVFNELLQICDTPDTAECVEETAPETTTPRTTTIKTTTAKPKPTLPPGNDPESCRGETNGTLLPHPSDCKQFYKCIEEEVTIETCPGELIYNSDLEICDYPYDFECGSATKPPKTTTAKPQTTPSNGICKGKPKGTKLPVEDDCTMYWMCLPTEEAVLIPCPAKNWFNPETGECGPNVSPDACRATGTTPAPSGTTTPSNSGNPCEGKPDYTNVPYPEDCKKYNMCVGGKPTVVSCPGNNWFNPDTGKCGPQVSPTACKNPTGTTPSGTTPEGTTSLPITTSAPGNNHGICGSLTNGEKVPYPGSCRKFVICGQPAPIADYCEYLLWFNEELQKCVFPEESDCKQPGWTLPPTTTTPTPEPTTEASTEPTKPTKPPPPKGPCDGMDYGTLLPYPNNCSKYIVCRTPINVGYDCPEGLEFSVAERTCMLPEWANCNSGGNGGSSRELFMGASFDECAFQMDGTTLPYFDNCGQYIICQNNRQLIHSCYPNTFYNPEKGSCDKATLSTACRQSIIPKIAKPSCQNLKSGSVLSVKNDWSRYYLCSEGESIQLQCKENWHFDAIQAKCVQ